MLDGNSEHDVHARRKQKAFWRDKKAICDYSGSHQTPQTDRITKIAPEVRTFF